MILGYNPTLRQATLEEELRYCEKYQFGGIELRIEKLKSYLQRNTLRDLKKYFSHSQLKPLSLNAIEQVLFPDDATKKRNSCDLDFLCEVAIQLDIKDLVVVPSFHNTEYTVDEIKQESIKILNGLLKKTVNYDIRFAYEFVGNPRACVNTFEQCYEIIEEINSERVGVSLDFFHFYAMNSSIDSLKDSDVEKIFLVHINDADFYPPGALREDEDRLFPGEGAIPIQKYINILKQKGYTGIISVELFREEYNSWNVGEFIKRAKESSKSFLL